MPKGKILMGETTPRPLESADKINGERSPYIGDLKGNFYSVDFKTGKQTLITAGPKTKKLPPKPVKPKPKGGIVDPKRKNPVNASPRRVDLNKVGVAYGKSKKQVKTFRGR